MGSQCNSNRIAPWKWSRHDDIGLFWQRFSELTAQSGTPGQRGQNSVHQFTVNSSITSSELLYPPAVKYSYAPRSKLDEAVQLGVAAV
jgi:hypothetical protein